MGAVNQDIVEVIDWPQMPSLLIGTESINFTEKMNEDGTKPLRSCRRAKCVFKSYIFGFLMKFGATFVFAVPFHCQPLTR